MFRPTPNDVNPLVHEGDVANESGLPREDNPYLGKTPADAAWLAGWDEAQP